MLMTWRSRLSLDPTISLGTMLTWMSECLVLVPQHSSHCPVISQTISKGVSACPRRRRQLHGQIKVLTILSYQRSVSVYWCCGCYDKQKILSRQTNRTQQQRVVMVSVEISRFTHDSPAYSTADTPHPVTVSVSNSISEEMEVEVQSSSNNDDDSHTSSDENWLCYLLFHW